MARVGIGNLFKHQSHLFHLVQLAQANKDKSKDTIANHFLQVLNQKIGDKKAELDDTISYYSQREAEYETKIDELMTRLQEQTTMYMKLQAEFESYEWYEDGEVPETTTGAVEGEGDENPREGTTSRKSRESPMLRSRPPTRPPTRSDLEEVIDVFMFYL